ncbi:MAG: patatin-like phospholipase family protein [Burkholderiales bacterium]
MDFELRLPTMAHPMKLGPKPLCRTASRVGRLLYICRVPAIICAAIALLGANVDQIHEVVRVYVTDLNEPGHQTESAVNLLAVYLLLFQLSWTVLFWSEYALLHRFPRAHANNSVLRAATIAVPTLLVSALWGGAYFAAQGAAAGLEGDPLLLTQVLRGLVVMFGILTIVTYHQVKQKRIAGRRRYAGAREENPDPGLSHGAILGLSLAFGFGLFLVATLNPWWLGVWVGTIGILLAAAIATLPFLTWLTASPRVPRWHWLTVLVLFGILWSSFDLNDNHPLRSIGESQDSVKVPDFGAAFRAWLDKRASPTGREAFPVILVAAEGGGIRAAYFTAEVLAAIQDRCPRFARHLFVISGVSGGSVGAAIFSGLLDASKSQADDSDAPCDLRSTVATRYADQVEQILRTDYLAPVVATLLFPDGLQRLLPFPVDAWDRAKTLELTVERSFKHVASTNFMERSLYDYWTPEGVAPLLLLNTTHVSSGTRVVAAPVQFLSERFHRLTSLFDQAPTLNPRLSTAAVMGARFPLVTPAAYVGSKPKNRYVDGGYFENSGTVTLSEALDAMRLEAATLHRIFYPIVIRIGNSPSRLAASDTREAGPESPESPPAGLGELLSPVRAMVNTRVARGSLAAEALKTQVTTLWDNQECAEFIEFQIGIGDVQTPLGWQLSQAARRSLRAQLATQDGCDSRNGIQNGCSVQDVIEILNRTKPSGCPIPAG